MNTSLTVQMELPLIQVSSLMEKVKVLVVEDEFIVAESIVRIIDKIGYQCVGRADQATKALEMAIELKPDIALFDINLKGEETGIWLAQELKKVMDIPFIFMTSFGDKKTIEEATATVPYGYLIKPVDQKSIFAAVETALAKFGHEKKEVDEKQHGENIPDSENSDIKPLVLIQDALFIKDEYQYVKVSLSDIDFIKSDGNYVELHGNGQKKVFKETLKNIESKLTENVFFQVHRSYVVNVKKIQMIGSTNIVVNDIEIPIVKQRKDLLLELLNTLQ